MEPLDTKPIVAALLEPLEPATGGRNDLADEQVVGLLVRGYVDRALALFHEALGGTRTQDDAIDGIYRVATALNTIFLGTSGLTTVTIHPWNAPDQLGVFLRDTLDLDFPPDECVRALLVHMATQMMLALQGAQPDWQDHIEAMVLEVRDLLLGRLPDDVEAPPFA